MDRQQFHNALTKVWEVVGDANRYIDHAAPWTLRKTDPARMATVLYVLAEAIRRLAILCQPVMPDAMAKMLDQLAVDPAARAFRSEEHTSELQSLMRISYAVFCLKKKKQHNDKIHQARQCTG